MFDFIHHLKGMSDVTTGRIKQQLPEQFGEPALPDHDAGKIHSFPPSPGWMTPR
jgi:hypothetical protein